MYVASIKCFSYDFFADVGWAADSQWEAEV